MNPFRWTFRAQSLLGFLAIVAMLAYALYSQFYLGLLPCPLCSLQRGAYAVTAAVFLLAGLHAPRSTGGRRAYSLLAFIPAAVGAGIASRHVWLQGLPPEDVPACGPDLAYMMENFPLGQMLKKVLTGSGECAKVDWTFLGLAMSQWSLICFVVLALWALYIGFRRRSGRTRA